MNNRPDRAPWWNQGLRFSCLGCGRCCRGEPGAIYFTEGEEEMICDQLNISKDRFRSQYVTDRWEYRSIKEKNNGECLFYDPATARCAIYQVRPSQCRTWPFWPDILESPGQWAWASRRCPGIDQGRLWTESEIRSILEDQL